MRRLVFKDRKGGVQGHSAYLPEAELQKMIIGREKWNYSFEGEKDA